MYKTKSLLIALLLVLSNVGINAVSHLIVVNDSNHDVKFNIKPKNQKETTFEIMPGACGLVGAIDEIEDLQISYKRGKLLTATSSSINLSNVTETGDGPSLVVVRILSGTGYSIIVTDPGKDKIVRYTYKRTGLMGSLLRQKAIKKDIVAKMPTFSDRKLRTLVGSIKQYIKDMKEAQKNQDIMEYAKHLKETQREINNPQEPYVKVLGGPITFNVENLCKTLTK